MPTDLSQEYIRTHFDYAANGALLVKKPTSLKNSRRKVGEVAGWDNGDGYWRITVQRKKHIRHRMVWILHNGPIANGEEVDHINRQAGDDRIENLRLTNHRGNGHNRSNQSEYGVGIRKTRGGRYTARCRVNGRYVYIGTYDDPETATAMRTAYLQHKQR